MLLDFGVADYEVRAASDWAMDSVREGVVGGQKLEMYIGGYITGMRGCRMLCRSSRFSSSIRVGVAVDNLTRELLPWEEVGGRGTEVGEGYASVAEWHLAVSEQSFVLDLLVREDLHSYQITRRSWVVLVGLVKACNSR